MFEINIVAEQKQAYLVTIFLLFISFHALNSFTALPLLRRTCCFFLRWSKLTYICVKC